MENISEITNAYGNFKGALIPHQNKKAPWLVFLHGFPDDSQVWKLQLEALKSDFQIWSPDLYNHAFKDQIQGVASALGEIAADAEVFMIGHDMGGPVACEVARLYPEIVSKILLINTLSVGQFIGRWKNPIQWFRSLYMPFFMGPLHSTKWWRKLAKPFLESDTEVLEGIKRYREVAKEAPAFFKAPKQEIETHVLFGNKDPFVMTPTEEELRNNFTKFTLETLPTGHWPQRTSAHEVNQWIRKVVANG